MEATIVYGMSCDIKHEETLPVGEAFARIPELGGWAFVNIYYGDKLVFTTQGLAGRAWICEDCPYHKPDGRRVTRQQYAAIYNVWGK